MPCESHETGSSPEPSGSDSFDIDARRRQSERFRLILEHARDIVVEISRLGEVLYVSPAVRRILGFAPNELLGGSIFARVHPDDRRHVQERFARRAGHATTRHRHKDGSWRWLETSSREFITSLGQEHRVLIARDVTAKKMTEAENDRLEAERRRSEKLAALGALAGGIAHDFNNLLTCIIGYAHLAREEARESEAREALDQILKATDRAKHLSQQILRFCRQQKQTRQLVQLAPLVEEVLDLMRPVMPDDIEVILRLPDTVGWVLADATQLHQILINLCSNAVHAMQGRRGRLEVQLSRVALAEPRPPEFRDLPVGAYACLAVTDNGHGIDAGTQRRIFEPFFTTKPAGQGTGLGLAMVQRIVHEHDGTVQVASMPGEGTTFRILLPMHAAPQSAVAPGDNLRGHGEHILLVIDQPLACLAAATVLEDAGYAVTPHTTPQEALARFRAQPEDYDLVICDLARTGLAHAELASELRRIHPRIAVLMPANELGTQPTRPGGDISIRDVLVKPFAAFTLLDATRRALHSASEGTPESSP